MSQRIHTLEDVIDELSSAEKHRYYKGLSVILAMPSLA